MHSIERVDKSVAEVVYDDIFFSIFEKLDWIDRFRASRVCRHWLHFISQFPSRGQFPWLFSHKQKTSAFTVEFGTVARLTDRSMPSYDLMLTESTSNPYDESRALICGATTCDSKFGWVLMARSKKRVLFVFNPFRSKLMMLPPFNGTNNSFTTHHFMGATFSSSPTSPDCVFFTVFAYGKTLEIWTCKTGGKKWKKFITNSTTVIRKEDKCRLECVNGSLYIVILNDYGDIHVGIFEVDSKEWRMTNTHEKSLLFTAECNARTVIYENRELYVIRTNKYDVLTDMLRYDVEEDKWVHQSSLGNRVLFVGCSSFLVDAVGELGYLANCYICIDSRGAPDCPVTFEVPKRYPKPNPYNSYNSYYGRCKMLDYATWIIPSLS